MSKKKKTTSKFNSGWILILILAVIAVIVMYLSTQPFAAKVVSTYPANLEENVSLSTKEIKIEFSKELSLEQQRSIVIKFVPSLEGKINFPKNNQLMYQPATYLENDTLYKVSIFGKNIKEDHFQFKTRAFISPELTVGPENIDNKERLLRNSLPYRDEGFHITFSGLSKEYLIMITLTPAEEYKLKSIAYMRHFGFVNPEEQLDLLFWLPRNMDPDGSIARSLN